MSEITGTVKEIFRGETTKGRNTGDPFWSITTEENPDQRITCFKDEEEKGWIEGLEQGVEYTFTVKVSKDEKYINIAGQTVPCENVGEGVPEVETPKTPVKVATKRKPPVTTSTAGTERVFKNRISAGQITAQLLGTGISTKEDFFEWANAILEWISE